MDNEGKKDIAKFVGADKDNVEDGDKAQFNAGVAHALHLVELLRIIDSLRMQGALRDWSQALLTIYSHVAPYLNEEQRAIGERYRLETIPYVLLYCNKIANLMESQRRFGHKLQVHPELLGHNPYHDVYEFEIFCRDMLTKANLLNPIKSKGKGGLGL